MIRTRWSGGRVLAASLTLVAASGLCRKADAQEGRKNPQEDPEMTRRLLEFLSDIGKAVPDSPRMTPALRRFLIPGFSRGTANFLKDLQSFTFLAREESRSVIRGAPIRHIYYYRAATGQSALYYIFRLTPEGVVADIDIYPG